MKRVGNISRYVPYLLSALVLMIVIYIRVRLLAVPLERDEGEYAYMGQLILKGIPPFTHCYTLKLPGVSLVYAFLMGLFGQTPAGIHAGLLFVNLCSVFLVWALAQRLWGWYAALAAGSCYAVLSLSSSVLGLFAHAEHFVVLFSLAGFLLLHRYLDAARLPLLAACGLMFGLAFTMKQHAILLAIFAILYLAYRRRIKADSGWGRLAGESALFILGAVIPYTLIVIWMVRAEVFDQFWFWTVQYAREYTTEQTFSQGMQALASKFLRIATPQPLLWLLAAGGGVFLCTRHGQGADRVFVFGLLLFSFLAICPGLIFRNHYFVMLLPAVAILIGAAAHAAGTVLASAGRGTPGESLIFLMLAAAASYGFYAERGDFFVSTPLAVSRSIYGENPFPEALPIARYLKEHTAPGERIAVLGSEPEIYFYADRLSASGYIYMYGLVENQPYAERMQMQMMREIEAARPAYIVVVNVKPSWLVRKPLARAFVDWNERYVANLYTPVGLIDIIDRTTTLYLWNDQAAGYSRHPENFVAVFKRKSGA